MGWNDRNPELYESITGLSYETGLPLDGSMPAGWTPPPLPETCHACNRQGDRVNDPLYEGECVECGEPCCWHCSHEADADECGVTLWCSTGCYEE